MYTLIERGWKDCSHTIRVTFDSFNHFESLHITFKCQNHLQRSHQNKALLKLQMKLSKFSTLLLKILKTAHIILWKTFKKHSKNLLWCNIEMGKTGNNCGSLKKMLHLLSISKSWDVIIHTVLCCLPQATRTTFYILKIKKNRSI